jgi:hypothetical protein
MSYKEDHFIAQFMIVVALLLMVWSCLLPIYGLILFEGMGIVILISAMYLEENSLPKWEEQRKKFEFALNVAESCARLYWSEIH